MEFIVTMKSENGSEVSEIYNRDCFSDACLAAFFNRNIASSWDIVDVISDEPGFITYADLLPISGKYYAATGKVR